MADFIFLFIEEVSGATAIEYGLIASLISVAIITAAGTLGNNLASTFSNVAANMTK